MGGPQGFSHDSLRAHDLPLSAMEQEKSPLVALTPAVQADSEFLYALWDPEARAASFSGGPQNEETHRGWLHAVLADPDRHLFVATEHGMAVGSARLDTHDMNREAIVSVNVAPTHRKRGLGVAILRALDGEARALRVDLLLARIKDSNWGSRAAFLVAGYVLDSVGDGIVTMARRMGRGGVDAPVGVPDGRHDGDRASGGEGDSQVTRLNAIRVRLRNGKERPRWDDTLWLIETLDILERALNPTKFRRNLTTEEYKAIRVSLARLEEPE